MNAPLQLTNIESWSVGRYLIKTISRESRLKNIMTNTVGITVAQNKSTQEELNRNKSIHKLTIVDEKVGAHLCFRRMMVNVSKSVCRPILTGSNAAKSADTTVYTYSS